MSQYSVTAAADAEGRRLDLFLSDYFRGLDLGLSRTTVQKIIADGLVCKKNGEVCISHHKVKAGEEFSVSVAEKKYVSPAAENISLDVVYEDRDLAVINKQAGLVVHPAPGNPGHTLVNALLHRFDTLSDINPGRPGIVHRLDKETSGLLVIAKNNSAHLDLARQFAEHSIQRKYIAIVKGKMEFDENIIELPIARHPTKRKSMAVSFLESSKYAKTHYRTLKRGAEFSLVELRPFTGRTHQLRVHLSHMGHPILGDTKYGGPKFSRMALHAQSVGFIHPRTKKPLDFSSPLPAEFSGVVK